jgi:ribonuclease BN (tRNA processing enzyme)
MAGGYDTGGGDLLATLHLTVIGSSGSASPDRGSTAFLVGKDLAVDAGSLASGMPLEAQGAVRAVLLTHRHFDHVRELPLFLDNGHAEGRGSPVAVGAERGTLSALVRHVFNWHLWPDPREFGQARFFAVTPGKPFALRGLRVSAIRLHHTVPSVGYIFRRGGAAAAVLGDTGFREAVFESIARIRGLRLLTIEASYPSRLADLAERARHLTPDLLREAVAIVRRSHPRVRVLATHIKPPWTGEVEEELRRIEPPLAIAHDGERHRLF